jgi:hypothetical protein
MADTPGDHAKRKVAEIVTMILEGVIKSTLIAKGYHVHVEAGGWIDIGEVDDEGRPKEKRMPDKIYYTRVPLGHGPFTCHLGEAPPKPKRVIMNRQRLGISLECLRDKDTMTAFMMRLSQNFTDVNAEVYTIPEGNVYEGALLFEWSQGNLQ